MLNFNGIPARLTSPVQALKRNRQNFSKIPVPHACVDQRFLSTCTVLLAALMLYPSNAAAQSHWTAEERRDSVLTEYLTALDGCDIPTKIGECEFILSNCDSASRAETALKVFTHFRDSHLMGDENVAVYVADKWILVGGAPETGDKPAADTETSPGKDTETGKETDAAIREYVLFNRESLLGQKAPLLPEAGLESFSDSRMTVLWFYDTDCAKCALEAVLLENFLTRHPECGLTAFYVGDDPAKWETFRKGRFRQSPDVRHLGDLAGETDFRRKYSVTATPRMFLIDREGVIVGRMLDTESLETLLAERKKQEKEAVTELFYKLVPLRGEEAKNSLEYLIDNYILCENSPFDTAEDSLMTVNFAVIQKALLSKARPGTEIAPLKLRGRLNGGREKEYRLDRVCRRKGGLTVLFHTTGCRQCEEELAKASQQKRNILEINIDEIREASPETFTALIDSFDLTALPLLVETDSRGIILRRYFSL